jgi:hypothetical protein
LTEEQITTLSDHLVELRGKTLERLAALSVDGIADMGLVVMVANVQTALMALEAVGEVEKG